RAVHDRIFVRDQVLDLIDGTVYSCELPWTKPHPEAFRAAMAAVGEADPGACVFVGDRPFDDVHGAKSIGMRAVLMRGSTVPPFEPASPEPPPPQLPHLLPCPDGWNPASPPGGSQAVDESCLMVSPTSGRAAAKPGCPIG